jgi:CRISPR-associated protein Csa1
MFYFVLRDVKENMIEKLKSELGDPSRITIRGRKLDEVKLPSELSGRLLPVNLLANKFCPTNRDIFLNVVANIPGSPTWSSYKGRVIHKLCFKLAERAKGYILRRNIIQKIDILRYTRRIGRNLIRQLTSDMDREITRMTNRPSRTEKDNFLKDLLKLVRMESEIASTFADYIIATNFDVQLSSEFNRMFSFQGEISLNATPLGFSRGARPDFVYSRGNSTIVGDIKTGDVKPFHKLVVAAYALAYEYDTGVPINFGAILNIKFSNRRNVPIYKDTEIMVISDKYRQAFLALRDEKFEIVVNGVDPGLAPDESACTKCPYYSYCRS